MKKIAAIVTAAALALSVAACSLVQAKPNVSNAGSASGSEQLAAVEPAAVESEEPEVPEYDPVDLKCDNPLADVDIASVSLYLTGVGEYEITGTDAQTIKDIAQNEARAWQDSSGWDFFSAKYLIDTDYALRLMVTLDSGERLALRTFEVTGETANILRIDDEEYQLTPEEFVTFAEVHARAYKELCKQFDGEIEPYADLSADDLTKITRLRHYTEADQSEQVLTDEQFKMVIESLKNLEIDPRTAIFDPEMLIGGGYEYFLLWFENGETYYVGAYQSYSTWNEDYSEPLERFPVAMIDGVLYRCNADYATDMYWNYEETADYYQHRYLIARDIPEYPFKDITVGEITDIQIGVTKDGKWDRQPVPMDIAEDVVDVLKQIRYADDNKLERPDVSFDESVQRSNQITIYVNGNEQVGLGVDDGHLVMNQSDYIEDEGMLEALENLIARANSELE